MKTSISRSGGLATWSINHPVAVIAVLMTVIILGIFALNRLGVDLLPDIIYPEVRVRILNPGVPATIMEDEITRQLEEQLAITENASNVQSRTSEGRTNVDLSFPYGSDINTALRDASNRLDRSKRFLPDDIEPPIIYKRDPSQIPVMELIVSSELMTPVEIRSWVDYNFSKWFLNLPGIASTEVGGGLIREVNIYLDQSKLNHFGFTVDDFIKRFEDENKDIAGGKLYGENQEISIRALGRFQSINQIANLTITKTIDEKVRSIRLKDVAVIEDSNEDERLKIRLNGISGVKLSIQKQPTANTVAVAEQVRSRLQWLKDNKIIPADTSIQVVGDQSIFIKHSVKNASAAALMGALLAMLIVYLFLGNFTRTLIIGSAIPIAILVTFIIMNMAGITLNIMTLGGLALGIGMLVDSTIVMLENISRHQQMGEENVPAAINAAKEVNSPVIASTSTNLAAVLPFLLISGLTGLLFKELIITIAAAMTASLLVALTLVPAIGAKIKSTGSRKIISFEGLTNLYKRSNSLSLNHYWFVPLLLIPIFILCLYTLSESKSIFLPKTDEGNIRLSLTTDSGTQLKEMDRIIYQLENLLLDDPRVESIFTTVGGFVFGRSEFISSNRSSLRIQLTKDDSGKYNSDKWIKNTRKKIKSLKLTGTKVRIWPRGVRGVRLNQGEDDISIRVRGQKLETLSKIGDDIIEKIRHIDGLSNIQHPYEDINKELIITLKHAAASVLGITPAEIGRAVRLSLDGIVISEYIDGDQQFKIRLRNNKSDVRNVSDLNNVIVSYKNQKTIYLADVADFKAAPTTKNIYRDKQQRFVEISASLAEDKALEQALDEIEEVLADYELPQGYIRYQSDDAKVLKQGQTQGITLVFLAMFLVFVVMAIQYESLLNPFIILLTIPFGLIGVVAGIEFTDTTLSMSVWLGIIMLAGIVVNNAIVLVEQIEIERSLGATLDDAIVKASAIRLKPILMTTLTTAIGMSPLALGLGEGSEMLQPLAVVTVFGLSFSMLVSLYLLPTIYKLFHSTAERLQTSR